MIARALLTAIAATIVVWSTPSAAASCDAIKGIEQPSLGSKADTSLVCKTKYAALHDNNLLVSRWVIYRLTREESLGCVARKDSFHQEPELDKDRRAKVSDYDNTGYARGHQAPAEDFSTDADLIRESFSMANMSPQLGGLNSQGWARLEETVRAWAWSRKEVIVYTGVTMAKAPKKLGDSNVRIPNGFWKVLVDPDTEESIAIYMPHKPIQKGDIGPWQQPISFIEGKTGLSFNGIKGKAEASTFWPVDLKNYRRSKDTRCKGKN
jgi:endonuclease G